jgi:signal transduction histidine kinase
VSDLLIEHLDETGAPCAHHPPVRADAMLQLAMIGSRASAFHHDCASKLQGLVMALDELGELTEHGDPQVLRALESALDSTRELNALLNANRALTKLSARTPIAIGELARKAGHRVGVTVQGAGTDAMVDVGVPAMTHALALAIDVVAGSGRGRTVAIASAVVAHEVELVLHASANQPANASEALAIASFVAGREGGKLWCSAAGDRLLLRLPAAR